MLVEYVFATQLMQVAAVVAFNVVEYLPAPQLVHATLPVDVLYFPATQPMQGPPFGPVNPILQIQLVKAVEPAEERELAGHTRQVLAAEAPVLAEYVFATQLTQTAEVVAPKVVEYLPLPQLTQKVESVDPVIVRYLPASQFMHVSFPFTILYLPTAQAEHVPP